MVPLTTLPETQHYKEANHEGDGRKSREKQQKVRKSVIKM
jgi:hypothetical protein